MIYPPAGQTPRSAAGATRQILAFALLCAVGAPAQTTQATITGIVVDRATRAPLKHARVEWARYETRETGSAETDTAGNYALPLLSPGSYRLIVTRDGYLAEQIYEQQLSVAARLEIDFALRPASEGWRSAAGVFALSRNERLVHVYATDVERFESVVVDVTDASETSLAATRSYVIAPQTLGALPLEGRDAYALLVALPAVTADNSTARGLGVSVSGQRPSASNFLLDGLENNNSLVTGDLTPLPPEALLEYRISTANFSAEFGRTSGFLANAVTRSGGNAWHGAGWLYARNDALNAKGPRYGSGLPADYRLGKVPLKELQPGFQVGGPLWRSQQLYTSLTFDAQRFRSFADPVLLRLPSAAFLAGTPAGSTAGKLLSSLPLVAGAPGQPYADTVMSPTLSRNRYLLLPRIDRVSAGGGDRLLLRAVAYRLERPDFTWTPYRDFVSPLKQDALSAAAGWMRVRGGFSSELRAGWSLSALRLDRTQPEVPILGSFDTDLPDSPLRTLLPGSPLPYAYSNRTGVWQGVGNLSWVRARHAPKIGGGLLGRSIGNSLRFFEHGAFYFDTLDAYRAAQPFLVYAALDRAAFPARAAPDYGRSYRNAQFFAFAQDSFRVRRNLSLDYGVRYENFGVPVSTGRARDLLVAFGSGSDIIERLSNATVGEGGSLYDADNNNFAVRAGFSWMPAESAHPFVVRGSYGVFYDRPFDNLWLNLANNNFALGTGTVNPARLPGYIGLPGEFLAALPRLKPQSDFPRLSIFQSGFRDAYVHAYFFGLERAISDNLGVEAYASGTLGRKLVTTDIINRECSIAGEDGCLRYAEQLPPLDYRANEGASSYNALTSVLYYRSSAGQLNISYSWSHTIDNQSDALGGDFFNLGFTNPVQPGASVPLAQFALQFDSRVDRGSSDFDQRHNLVIYSFWELPAMRDGGRAARWLRGWRVGQFAAFRTGFPVTVNTPFAAIPGNPILVNRADLKTATGPVYVRRDQAGGVLLLDPNAFELPQGTLGNTGRNAFRGPGLFSLDVSLGRSFELPHTRLWLRADVFNVLNHANLNSPFAVYSPSNSAFGLALYGRKGRASAFPGALPLDETARQVQLSVRLEF